jgi:hypothetical protein
VNFVKYDLGELGGGEVVSVEVRERANVLLLDQLNFTRYQRQQQFSYSGGQAERSPVKLRVPRPGHWYVVLDLGGASGTIRSNVTLSG